jgi:hypothetical protein
MVKIETNPTLVEGEIVNRVGARIVNYDLDSNRCEVYFVLMCDTVGAYYVENWSIPTSILENWGTDDNIIFQAIADYKGFTLKE